MKKRSIFRVSLVVLAGVVGAVVLVYSLITIYGL